MTDRLQSDVTPTERTAIVTLALARGRALTARDVMHLTECAESTAYDVLSRLARVLPVYQDDQGRSILLDDFGLNIG